MLGIFRGKKVCMCMYTITVLLHTILQSERGRDAGWLWKWKSRKKSSAWKERERLLPLACFTKRKKNTETRLCVDLLLHITLLPVIWFFSWFLWRATPGKISQLDFLLYLPLFQVALSYYVICSKQAGLNHFCICWWSSIKGSLHYKIWLLPWWYGCWCSVMKVNGGWFLAMECDSR